MKKRILSILLAAGLIFGMLPLSACGGKTDTVARGEMLSEICDAFGMYDYAQEQPYIASVTADSPYFAAVQKCVEWNILGTDDQKYDVNKAVTRGELAEAVVSAAELAADDASQDEKLAAAAQNKLVPTGASGKISAKKKATAQEVSDAIAAAAALWSNKVYDTPVQNITYQDGVVDCTAVQASVTDTQVSLPVGAQALKPGDVYVYDTGSGLAAAKVASVTEQNGQYVITNSDEDFSLEELTQDVQVQQTYAPDLSQATFTDGAGNVYAPSGTASNASAVPSADGRVHLSALGTHRGANLMQTGVSGKIGCEVGGWKIEGSYDGSEVSVSLSTESEDKKNAGEFKVSFSNIRLTNEVDYSVFSGMKSFTSRVDYNSTVSGTWTHKFVDKIAAPYNNGNGKWLSNLARTVVRNQYEASGEKTKGAKYIKLGSWDIVEGGAAQVRLELRVNITVEGEISVTLNMTGAKGIEFKNGHIRFIKEETAEREYKFEAKAEVTLSPSIRLRLFKKWDIARVEANAGLGASASAIMRLADEQNHLLETVEGADVDVAEMKANGDEQFSASPQAVVAAAAEQGVPNYDAGSADVQTHIDTCLDVSLYAVLSFTAGVGDSVKKWVKALDSAEVSYEVLNEDNGTFARVHYENFDFSNPLDHCTKEYTPFGASASSAASGAASASSSASNPFTTLALQDALITLAPGESRAIVVTGYPDGVTQADLKFASQDTAVATVDAAGNVTGTAAGTTQIEVTEPGGAKQYCTVTVTGAASAQSGNFLPGGGSGGGSGALGGGGGGGGFR